MILPAVRRFAEPARRVTFFDAVEGRFAFQARISTLVAGLSGFFLIWRTEAFDRFLDPGRFWFIHAMVALWAIFTVVLFVLEPLVQHRWFSARAARDPESTMAIVLRVHRVLSTVAIVTVGGAVLGAHGGL